MSSKHEENTFLRKECAGGPIDAHCVHCGRARRRGRELVGRRPDGFVEVYRAEERKMHLECVSQRFTRLDRMVQMWLILLVNF